MRTIGEIRAFEDDFELFELPAVRVIGKEIACGLGAGAENPVPAFWAKVFETGDCGTLFGLPHVVADSLCGWTCDHVAETNSFSYIVSVMTPADTPVPEGFVHRDIPATVCAKGLFGEDLGKTVARARALGHVPNYDPYGWNAELYLGDEESNPPKTGCDPWHWLVPVRAVEGV